jgi:glycosyltransferase involved in cell wall biosynthesis
MISLIIPTYNGAQVLERYSLPSLLRQTFSDWEALIINDGSTDNSSKIVKEFILKDRRLKLIEQPENLGLAAALNLGIKMAKGDLIAILEHDDIWLPEKLEIQARQMEKGVKFSINKAIIYNTDKKSFTKINGGNFSGMMFTKDFADFIFPLPEENKKYLGIEDGIFTARLEIAKSENNIKDNEYININEILTIMNSNDATLSGEKNSLIMKNRYRNILDLYVPLSGRYKGLDELIHFWKNHYYFNSLLSHLPKYFQKIIYAIVNFLKEIKNGRQIHVLRQDDKFKNIKKYRELFD